MRTADAERGRRIRADSLKGREFQRAGPPDLQIPRVETLYLQLLVQDSLYVIELNRIICCILCMASCLIYKGTLPGRTYIGCT